MDCFPERELGRSCDQVWKNNSLTKYSWKKKPVRKDRNRDGWRKTSAGLFIAHVCSGREREVGRAVKGHWSQRQAGGRGTGVRTAETPTPQSPSRPASLGAWIQPVTGARTVPNEDILLHTTAKASSNNEAMINTILI